MCHVHVKYSILLLCNSWFISLPSFMFDRLHFLFHHDSVGQKGSKSNSASFCLRFGLVIFMSCPCSVFHVASLCATWFILELLVFPCLPSCLVFLLLIVVTCISLSAPTPGCFHLSSLPGVKSLLDMNCVSHSCFVSPQTEILFEFLDCLSWQTF